MWDRIAHFLTNQVYKIIEYIGGFFSFCLFQLGIPLETAVEKKSMLSVTLQDITLSIMHGAMSIFITVLGFYVIHVLKKVLENKESRASKITEWIVDKFTKAEEE